MKYITAKKDSYLGVLIFFSPPQTQLLSRWLNRVITKDFCLMYVIPIYYLIIHRLRGRKALQQL